MVSRKLVLAAGTMLAGLAIVAPASAQSVSNIEGAQLLSPFTTLLNSDAGRQALVDNLDVTVQINNSADQARRDRAISDNSQLANGSQFTVGLGTTLDSAYQQAVAANDPAIATITSQIGKFTSVTSSDSAFGKTFFANGKTSSGTVATGPALPPGGQFNVYDQAYGVKPTDPGQNPNGNSRPYQVAPGRIDNFAPTITAGLTSNSAFPSGHTTFGTTISLLMAMAVPERFSQEFSRSLDYGYSRVVLGAHYVMDVIGGRILATHDVANLLNNNPNYTNGQDFKAIFSSFQNNFRSVLGKYAGTDVASAARLDNGPYSDAAALRAQAVYRLTYGLTPTGATNLPPVVPDGAEVLLSTRFAYLSAEQRRDVLASTEIASGAPLDDGSGWARLDLYSAGQGYGSFTNQVVVNQDASLGGSAAQDVWTNDIGGTGGLTHQGTGTLALTGNNSYTGTTVIAGGMLIAGSSTALGRGDVLLQGGALKIAAAGFKLAGNFVETGGMLDLTEFGTNDPLIAIAGLATLGGGLSVDLNGFGNAAGEYELLSYGSHNGEFGSVSYTGLGSGLFGNLVYRDGGLFLDITADGAVPEPASWAMMIAGFGLVGFSMRRRALTVTYAQAI